MARDEDGREAGEFRLVDVSAGAEEEADKNEGLLEITEGNVVSACSVLSASVVLDALNALPSTIVVDVPTSLRTTALVLIALVAAPPVDPNLLFEQRGVAGVCLFASAFVGLHQGGVNARIADALYSLLCGWAVLLIFGVSGPKPGEKGYDAKGKRENVLALSAGFLGYSGARIVRAALYHAGEQNQPACVQQLLEAQAKLEIAEESLVALQRENKVLVAAVENTQLPYSQPPTAPSTVERLGAPSYVA